MKLVVIKGEISGSIIIGKTIKIKLNRKVLGGEVILASSDNMRLYSIDSDNIDVSCNFEVDRCMIMNSDGKMIGYGSEIGKVNRSAMLDAYYKVKNSTTSCNNFDDNQSDNTNLLVEKASTTATKVVIESSVMHADLIDNKTANAENQATDLQENTHLDYVNSSEFKHENKDANTTKVREGIYIKPDDNYENAVQFASKIMKSKEKKIEINAEFYATIYNDINSLFDIYPHNIELEEVVFDSTWVNIESDNGSEYSVGVINDDGVPSVIVYGVFKETYVDERGTMKGYEWLPLDKSNPEGRGYYIAYQDACTGDMLGENN